MAGTFTFYGVVTDDYFADDGQYIDIDPEAFGYVAGQKITAYLHLTGAAEAAYDAAIDSSGRGEVILNTPDGTDFHFPGGTRPDWTEEDILPFGHGPIQILSRSNSRPLTEFAAALYPAGAADGPGLAFTQFNYGQAHFTNDDDAQLDIFGVWLPDTVTPKLFHGGVKSDTLKAKGEVALAWGGLGNDKISMSGGALFAWGGQGDDTIFGAGKDDKIFGDFGRDDLRGGGGDDHLFGGDQDDEVRGEKGDDLIDGGRGNDELKGGDGDDVIYGGTGVNLIFGEDGDDLLYAGQLGPNETGLSVVKGGDGDDRLVAYSTGILRGGEGDDIFQVGDSENRFAATKIIIEDFDKGEDRINIAIPGIHTFEALMSYARQDGKNLVFDLNPQAPDAITLIGVKLSALKPGDFIFNLPDE